MDRLPAGPELILDDLEFLREMWDEIKGESREYCREEPSAEDIPCGTAPIGIGRVSGAGVTIRHSLYRSIRIR